MLAVMVAALREVSHWLALLGQLPAELLRAERCIQADFARGMITIFAQL